MNIDFNNVRRQAVDAYNNLVKNLNECCHSDAVSIQAFEIKNDLDNLKSAIVGIACTYEDGNDDFKCVLGDDDRLRVFNEDEYTSI